MWWVCSVSPAKAPIERDYSHVVFGHFPEMFTVIALLTFLLLARAFRSVVLAAKAVLLNLLSLAATFGLLTWFWQEGHGSQAIFGTPATGAITFWVPLMVFAFLLGSPWTTKCSSSPGCEKSTTAPAAPTRLWWKGSVARGAW